MDRINNQSVSKVQMYTHAHPLKCFKSNEVLQCSVHVYTVESVSGNLWVLQNPTCFYLPLCIHTHREESGVDCGHSAGQSWVYPPRWSRRWSQSGRLVSPSPDCYLPLFPSPTTWAGSGNGFPAPIQWVPLQFQWGHGSNIPVLAGSGAQGEQVPTTSCDAPWVESSNTEAVYPGNTTRAACVSSNS